MTEQELRALVRETIALYVGASQPTDVFPAAGTVSRVHSSHALFTLPTGSDGEGPCIVEPAVPCTHCGYCRSYGH